IVTSSGLSSCLTPFCGREPSLPSDASPPPWPRPSRAWFDIGQKAHEMDSVLFLLAVIGIVVVVTWSVMNDRVPFDGRTRGLLAMREAAPAEPPEPQSEDRKEEPLT